MFYYSYLMNENSPSKRPTVDDYKILYSHLPLDIKGIWAQDMYHAAETNEYLVPTKFCIRLYANLPIREKLFTEELCFNCGSIINGNINSAEFDSIVEGLRYFETRRNLYLMDQHQKGHNPKEYRHNLSMNSFDITTSNRMAIFNSNDTTEDARPNYRVSESFLKEFYGHDYETYVNNKNNTLDGFVYNFNLKTNVTSIEEWNTKVVNWINRNIYDLANLGFYATNFPDIIFFDSGFSGSTSYPTGEVHKAFIPNSLKQESTGIFSFIKLKKS